MSNTRACKSGLAAEAQQKIEGNFDPSEAGRCLHWVKLMSAAEDIPGDSQVAHDRFHEVLKDGIILSKLVDKLMPGRINWQDKTFQTAKIEAMKTMRERERIATFTKLIQEFGVDGTYTFPTESLHEKGVLNLVQVCTCIRALGIEAQSKPNFNGPENYWPKKSEKNSRAFSDDQLKAGQNVISLQYGTNKGANQSGMNMGKGRSILD